MAWASKKQYAILMGSDEGKDLATKIGDMTQDEFQNAFAKFLGKTGNASYKQEDDEDLRDDDYSTPSKEEPKKEETSDEQPQEEPKKENPREKEFKDRVKGLIDAGYDMDRVYEELSLASYYGLDKDEMKKWIDETKKQRDIDYRQSNERTTKNGFSYNKIDHPRLDEDANIIEEYNDGDDKYFIEQRPHDFVNHYIGGGNASGFKTLDEARQMMAKHRPNAKLGKSLAPKQDEAPTYTPEQMEHNDKALGHDSETGAIGVDDRYVNETLKKYNSAIDTLEKYGYDRNELQNLTFETFPAFKEKFFNDWHEADKTGNDPEWSKKSDAVIDMLEKIVVDYWREKAPMGRTKQPQDDKKKASKMFGVDL